MLSERPNAPRLDVLEAEHPEWRALLVLVKETLREMRKTEWSRIVPTVRRGSAEGPLLGGTTMKVAPRLIGEWMRRLVAVAAAEGVDVEPFDRAVNAGWLDPLRLFETAFSDSAGRFHDASGVVRALAPLTVMPVLHACRRAWAEHVPAGWACGYCPICGRWPALVEMRGIDGPRRARCACCGSAWRTDALQCLLCGERHDEQLGSLVSSDDAGGQTVDVCDSCNGYVKTVTPAIAMHAEDVVLHDLATMALDVAAVEHGYRRPSAMAREVSVSVVAERLPVRVWFGRDT